MKPIVRSQLITVEIPAGATAGLELKFPDIPELRDAIVMGLEAYDGTDLSTSPQGGTAVIVPNTGNALVVNLVQESDRRGQDYPYVALQARLYGGIVKQFDDWRLNFQKCYLKVVEDGIFTEARCVAINVFYRYAGR